MPNADGSDDVLRVPFDREGRPTTDPERMETWDLRVGRRVRLTGGTYAGDVGTIMEKSADGSYRIRFEDSVHPTFNVKRRPFSLWLGSWWHLRDFPGVTVGCGREGSGRGDGGQNSTGVRVTLIPVGT